MKSLNGKNRILIGITLFSMFFGAGNLIFPPFLGAQAGSSTLAAFAGFAVSAVCLPVLGVAAVTKSGGLKILASRVHPVFSYVYILILYLAIGPCLAIPRTASTSFSIAVTPFLPTAELIRPLQLVYSLVFFSAAVLVAMHPEKLTEYLGKRLTPVLLILIGVIFTGSLFHPAGSAALPVAAYEKAAAVQGFLDGYQTMDTLAALNFGMIVAMNIRAKGIEDEKGIMNETIYAGWIAGAVLLTVYGMLSYVGMISSQRFAGAANGTETLTKMVSFLFGSTGAVILALIFVIACFNTCVGLFSCCGKYFEDIFPWLSYPKWVCVFALVSMVISNVGLDAILTFSVPALNAIYPLAILLIFLSCIHHLIEKYPLIYPWAAFFCGISSLVHVMEDHGVSVPVLGYVMKQIPGYNQGFGWVLPTAAGFLLGAAADMIKKHLDRRKGNGNQGSSHRHHCGK